MAKSKPNQKGKRRKVTFTLDYPGASEVILVGDFNQWDPKIHPMKADASGVWKKATLLYPGRYEYRFWVDGQWKNDPANPQMCLNSFGTYNNFIDVEP